MSRSPDDPIPTDEILDSLDLSRAEPGLGFLEALFARFNLRVPFETATKILRNAQIQDPAEKPRWPAVFWNDHLGRGAGGTCFARVAAFEALLKGLGFSVRKVFGRVERDLDHAALVVSDRGGLWICDVGFPLPALLRAAPGRVETALAELEVAARPDGFRVEFLSGVPEGPRSVEIFTGEVSEESFRHQWKETFGRESRFLAGVALRRQEASRVLSFARGQIRVDDRHSRLTVPLTNPRPQRLSELFRIDRALLEQAFSFAGDPPSEESGSRLTAYLPVAASVRAAFDAIGGPEGYRRFLSGVAEVTLEEKTPSGWRVVLTAPSGAVPASGAMPALPDAVLIEEVASEPTRRAVRVRRGAQSGSVFDSEFRVEERFGRTYLVREALFDSPREDLLRNDSLRGRLAGTLAVDLLAWARLISP